MATMRCIFQILLHDAEGDGRLRGGAGLGDHDAGDVAFGAQVHEFGEVFLGEVVAREDDLGGVLLGQLLCEVVAQGFDGALRAEIGSADADGDHQIHALGLPVVPDGLAVRDEAFRRLGRQVLPAEEIIPRAVSGDQHVECLEGLAHILLIFVSVHETVATFYVNFYHNVYFLKFVQM